MRPLFYHIKRVSSVKIHSFFILNFHRKLPHSFHGKLENASSSPPSPTLHHSSRSSSLSLPQEILSLGWLFPLLLSSKNAKKPTFSLLEKCTFLSLSSLLLARLFLLFGVVPILHTQDIPLPKSSFKLSFMLFPSSSSFSSFNGKLVAHTPSCLISCLILT